ncbi:MAG: histidinol-phosphate transaminase [Candidatus Omnitrophica bacterium]|nr:histidinol-phosphate transaminase [Candidatus Omnitrophota bacterium]
MIRLANKNILKIRTYKPGKPIEEVKRELRLKDRVIKMASNENTLSPSRRVLGAIKRKLNDLNRYPDGGCFYLKRAVSTMLRLEPENLIFGNGSDEIIILALKAFTKKGDEVIVARPTFLIYEIASLIQDLKVKVVPLKGFRYDLDKMAEKLSEKTKIVFIANPDNPTGSYVTGKELDCFMKKVGKDTIVFLDEAYYEFAKNMKNYPKSIKYLKAKNVIITRTFSKIYALAGLRVGYGVARKELISAMNKVREPFNVNSLAQAAAVEAVNDNKFVSKTLKLTATGKQYLYKNLESLGYDCVKSATNFILVNLKRNSKLIYRKLLKKGIIVREMSQWGLKGFIRVTIGTMSENKRFIKALKEV